jgi:hypothetical protein|mmetsp:Transcript_64534/g.106879  ORF Transcript_64534/g.106879 Transcript_64534/m.106879 type:complete len:84 (+) Transcript_64534:2471-2722(+)
MSEPAGATGKSGPDLTFFGPHAHGEQTIFLSSTKIPELLRIFRTAFQKIKQSATCAKIVIKCSQNVRKLLGIQPLRFDANAKF